MRSKELTVPGAQLYAPIAILSHTRTATARQPRVCRGGL